MKYRFLLIFSFLLLGAGCPPQEQQIQQKNSVVSPTPSAQVDQESISGIDGAYNSITLQAYELGNGEVFLEWTPLPLDQLGMIRLLRSRNEEPPFPGSYWFQQKNNTHITWVNNPNGTYYFRACVFYNGACTAYSNTIALDLSGNTSKQTTGMQLAQTLLNSNDLPSQIDSYLSAHANKAEILATIEELKNRIITVNSIRHLSTSLVEVKAEDGNGPVTVHLGTSVTNLGAWQIDSITILSE